MRRLLIKMLKVCLGDLGYSLYDARSIMVGHAWKELPLGSYVAYHKPVGLYAFYLRTVDGYDAPRWTSGPIYDRTRHGAILSAHEQWISHCDYHGIAYQCDKQEVE